MIIYISNFCTSVLNQNCWYKIIKDYNILNKNFESFSIALIADKTFLILCFYFFITKYLEKKNLCFTNMHINLHLMPVQKLVKNIITLVITDLIEKLAKKKNIYVLKKKAQNKRFYRLLLISVFFYSDFSILLLSYLMLAIVVLYVRSFIILTFFLCLLQFIYCLILCLF